MSGSVACSKRARPWNQCRLLSAAASSVAMLSIAASAVAVTLLVAFSTARGAVALSVQLGRREAVGVGASCGGRAPLVSATDRWREKGWDNPRWKVRANVGADTSTCRFRWRLASSSVPASLHEQLQVGRCEEKYDPPPPSLDREVASVATPKQSSTAVVEVSMGADTVIESEALQEAVRLQLPPEPRILPTSPTVSAVDSSVVEYSQNQQHQQRQQQDEEEERQQSQQRQWPKRQSITVGGRINISRGRRWTPPRNSSVRSSKNINIGRNDITSGNQIATLSGISSRGTNNLNNYSNNRNRTRSVTTSSKEDTKKRRDNEVRMFLLERGLSQEEVRKILPVTRRDPRLMSDIGVLAAKMQAIADLLQSAASWFPPAADTGSGGGTGKMETVDGRAMCARLSAYQLISSEPRLLLLDVEPALKCRLRFLLSLFPWLLDHRWDEARLLKAAPLLAITSTTLQGRYQRLVELLPEEVDVQAMVCQVPLLLGRSSEGVAETLGATQELVPGLQLKRVLRHAPQLLAQPKWVVQRRLATLRAMLGLDMCSLPGTEKEQPTGSNGAEQRPRTMTMTLARFANLFPRILVMNPHTLRVKLEGLERLLTGLDAAALVRSRPSLLGFNVRTNLSTKVSRLRALLGPDVDLSTAVARCPSLLSMGSTTVAAKVKTLQESLPPGLDARHVIAKEPRVLSLDAASTVPRKMGDLARAFSEHAEADADQTAAMMAQVLKYNPNALRYDSDNVAGKIIALREAGLPAAVVRSIVRDAPRCLSAAAGTLVERVSILEKAFPSVPAARLVEGAPCLLQKHIAPDAQVSLLGELFPFAEPVSLVEKAPMLLALGENTLRVKTDTWRHVLEPRLDVSWEETISLVPRILCQGLGRAARIAYLRDPPASPRAALGDRVEGHGADTLTAGKALTEVCRRVADFARDHPSYPSFLYSLLAETTSGVGADGADGMNASRSSSSLSPDEEWSNSVNGACSDGERRLTGFRGVAGASTSPLGRGDVGIGGQKEDRARASPTGRIDAGLVGDRRQRHHWQQWRQLRRRDQNALPSPAEASTTARGGGQGSTMSATPAVVVATRTVCSGGTGAAGAGPQLSPPTATAGDCAAAVSVGVGDDALLTSPAASSHSSAEACKGGEEDPFELSAEEEYDLVAAERALGAVICAMTREAGGREASAMLLLVPRTADAVERNGSLTAYRSTGARL